MYTKRAFHETQFVRNEITAALSISTPVKIILSRIFLKRFVIYWMCFIVIGDHKNPSVDTLFDIQSWLLSEILLETVFSVMTAYLHI